MRKTNEELRNFNKLINRKNKNLLLVMETLDNETEKVGSSVKILEDEEVSNPQNRLSNKGRIN
jgi:hypothetical protein